MQGIPFPLSLRHGAPKLSIELLHDASPGHSSAKRARAREIGGGGGREGERADGLRRAQGKVKRRSVDFEIHEVDRFLQARRRPKKRQNPYIQCPTSCGN